MAARCGRIVLGILILIGAFFLLDATVMRIDAGARWDQSEACG